MGRRPKCLSLCIQRGDLDGFLTPGPALAFVIICRVNQQKKALSLFLPPSLHPPSFEKRAQSPFHEIPRTPFMLSYHAVETQAEVHARACLSKSFSMRTKLHWMTQAHVFQSLFPSPNGLVLCIFSSEPPPCRQVPDSPYSMAGMLLQKAPWKVYQLILH